MSDKSAILGRRTLLKSVIGVAAAGAAPTAAGAQNVRGEMGVRGEMSDRDYMAGLLARIAGPVVSAMAREPAMPLSTPIARSS